MIYLLNHTLTLTATLWTHKTTSAHTSIRRTECLAYSCQRYTVYMLCLVATILLRTWNFLFDNEYSIMYFLFLKLDLLKMWSLQFLLIPYHQNSYTNNPDWGDTVDESCENKSRQQNVRNTQSPFILSGFNYYRRHLSNCYLKVLL